MPLNPDPVLQAAHVSKAFAGRRVLDDFQIDVRRGEIHALVGQNGSGKSTFIRILAGYHPPEVGASLSVTGIQIPTGFGPSLPAKLGIAFVHQDLGLLQSGTVVENFRIGQYETGPGWRISWRRERQHVQAALSRFGLEFDCDVAVGSLSPVHQAMLAIARAVDRVSDAPAALLVLDEPTAYLPRDGIEKLFSAMKEVAAGGLGVLFVTHKLGEVLEVSDRVTVVRDGCHVETASTKILSEDDLIQRILGFALDRLYPDQPPTVGTTVLAADGIGDELVKGLTLQLCHGEVVGVTGLVGMGYERVPYLLYGAGLARRGVIRLGERAISVQKMVPRDAIAMGIGLLPGDRSRHGAVAKATVAENVTLPTLRRYFLGGLLRLRVEAERVRHLLRHFAVRPAEPQRKFATLSGGNQQKALLAKWFETQPEVLLLHEPTQGVDIGSRKEIFEQIRDVAARGTAILMASAEYEDLAHLCDRVIVMRHGRQVSELRGRELTYERILEQCFRGADDIEAADIA